MLPFVFLSALLWGTCIAVFIRFTDLGRFLSLRLTWFLVAIGFGGDFLLSLLLIDETGRIVWWQFVALVAISSIPVSVNGIIELAGYNRSVMDAAKDTAGE